MICIFVAVAAAFCLGACGHAEQDAVDEIVLEDGLPEWELEIPYTVGTLPEDAASQGLTGIYTTESDYADIYVYEYPKDGKTLETFGEEQAAAHKVFCNPMKEDGCAAAVLNYYEKIDGESYFIQAHIYEGASRFIEVRSLFKTWEMPIGASDLSFRLIREYTEETAIGSAFPYEAVYVTENDNLPELRVRQFAKDDFPAESYDAAALTNTTAEQYAVYAADGWTLEEWIALYDDRFDLIKGEVMERNGLQTAFIAYVDDGIFKTRAIIDDGAGYIMLCAEAEADEFQHITNALIDSVTRMQ